MFLFPSLFNSLIPLRISVIHRQVFWSDPQNGYLQTHPFQFLFSFWVLSQVCSSFHFLLCKVCFMLSLVWIKFLLLCFFFYYPLFLFCPFLFNRDDILNLSVSNKQLCSMYCMACCKNTPEEDFALNSLAVPLLYCRYFFSKVSFKAKQYKTMKPFLSKGRTPLLENSQDLRSTCFSLLVSLFQDCQGLPLEAAWRTVNHNSWDMTSVLVLPSSF